MTYKRHTTYTCTYIVTVRVIAEHISFLRKQNIKYIPTYVICEVFEYTFKEYMFRIKVDSHLFIDTSDQY